MNSVITSKIYTAPPISRNEILRYAGCGTADGEVSDLLDLCIKEAGNKLTYKICYRELPVTIRGDECDFGLFSLRSKHLSANLNACHRVVLFAATLGVEMDRLITKYSRISPARALMFQAMGAERIEALCDTFCEELKQGKAIGIKPRFSPGYGDLPLLAQKDIFSVLDCAKYIGLSLNDSLVMSPSKSVTAFVGLMEEEVK